MVAYYAIDLWFKGVPGDGLYFGNWNIVTAVEYTFDAINFEELLSKRGNLSKLSITYIKSALLS